MMPTDGSLRTFDPNEMPEDLMALVEDMSIIREKLNAEIRRNRELYALYLPLKSVVIQQLSEALEKVLAYVSCSILVVLCAGLTYSMFFSRKMTKSCHLNS